ncbi:YgaP family membrane protein [Sphingobacterium corticibacter]|uniref:DUF2892 domain-containing protein n=1 Tax=Sphingobacterium corticibacter TaxID=2171749 RepID=A0A2T8HJ02_9SPHI|nr:DUF2892 domain-containing protein [Sphingobacterium corticibacter]PVH25350.1 DUF2892 domain-containing protein [Sphingobacterium corticibacter]
MSILNKTLETLKDKLDAECTDANVGGSERILSVIAGGFILGVGVKNLFRSPLTSFSGIALGGSLVYRGVTGKCRLTSAFNKEEEKPDTTVIEHRYFVK